MDKKSNFKTQDPGEPSLVRADHHVTGMASGNDLLAYLTPELTGRPRSILSSAAYHGIIYP